jgi:hypothetical protein
VGGAGGNYFMAPNHESYSLQIWEYLTCVKRDEETYFMESTAHGLNLS